MEASFPSRPPEGLNSIFYFYLLPCSLNWFVCDVPKTRSKGLDVFKCRVLFTSSCKFSENLGCTADRKGADQPPPLRLGSSPNQPDLVLP